jgi:hypothetical protein
MTITNQFKKITSLADTNLIYSYYDSFFINRKYPRFFMSLLYTIDNGDYYYGIVNECLCILKKKMIGQPIVYLTIPPISKTGNITVEKYVMDLFLKERIKTRISEEDFEIYGLDIKAYEHKKPLDEFLYPLRETSIVQGKEWETFRRFCNKFSHDCFIGYDHKNMDYKTYKQVKELNSKWETYKVQKIGKSKNRAFKTVSTIDVFNLMDMDKFSFTGVYDKEKNLICYDLSERISANQVILVTRYFDYTNPHVNNSAYFLHRATCGFWYNKNVYGLGNFGSSVGNKELYESKVRLKPIKILKLYEHKNVGKITIPEYKQICNTGDLI